MLSVCGGGEYSDPTLRAARSLGGSADGDNARNRRWLDAFRAAGRPHRRLAVDTTSAGVLYATSGQHVWRSTTSGAHWIDANVGVLQHPTGVLSTPGAVYAYAAQSNGPGLTISRDGGMSWQLDASAPTNVAVLAVNTATAPPTLFATSGCRAAADHRF